MKYLTSYASYEEANDRQLDLLAAGIDAQVEYSPAGHVTAITTGSGLYHLYVEEEQAEAAFALVSPAFDPSAESIAACPACGSSVVREIPIPPILDFSLLMIPSMIEFIRSRTSGARYICEQCKTTYRKSLTNH